jgi:hypothetical protein
MTYEESAIVTFLQGSLDAFVGRKEIARKAVKRKVFEENPHWVDGPLASLLNQGVVEQNASAQYRLKRDDFLR